MESFALVMLLLSAAMSLFATWLFGRCERSSRESLGILNEAIERERRIAAMLDTLRALNAKQQSNQGSSVA